MQYFIVNLMETSNKIQTMNYLITLLAGNPLAVGGGERRRQASPAGGSALDQVVAAQEEWHPEWDPGIWWWQLEYVIYQRRVEMTENQTSAGKVLAKTT